MLFLMRNWITSGTCENVSDFAEQEHRGLRIRAGFQPWKSHLRGIAVKEKIGYYGRNQTRAKNERS
jgi:hypothetical protein